MSLLVNEGSSASAAATSSEVSTTAPSAFHRVPQASNLGGVVPPPPPNRDETTPTPASSTASDSPPTLRRPPFGFGEDDDDDEDTRDRLSSTEMGDNAFAWPTHNSYDEQRQLLGTEEESSDHGSSEEEEELMMANSSLPPSVNCPSGGGKKSVWSITREQINYYTTQFFCMQSDPDGVIAGTLAKEFFEKSRLPIADLRKIWQLSDVSQDGCLSLEEFLTAMHLVVLKRNEIDLPETLPPVLMPPYLKTRMAKNSSRKMVIKPTVANHNKDLYNGATPSNEESNERLISAHDHDEVDKNDDKKQTASEVAETASETASIVSSPGRPQPVNFDFHTQNTLRRDPSIVQPVAVRLSPDSPILQSSDLEDEEQEPRRGRTKASRAEVGYEKLWNAGGKDYDQDDEDQQSGDSIVNDEASGPISLPASRLVGSGPNNKKEPSPPPPPPRGASATSRSHTRSSSLDLNNFSSSAAGRPPLPPRFADASLNHPRLASISSGTTGGLGRDGRALQCRILEYREKNSVIARTNNELHQEVSDALEERIALEFQLEQLKSFGDE